MRLIRGTAIALLLAVAACGELPQPFAHGGEGPVYPLAGLVYDVRVAPVAGLPAAAARGLARAVAEHLGAYGVTATADPEANGRFVVAGAFEPSHPGPGGGEGQLRWTLLDDSGEVTGIHVDGTDGAPLSADPPDPAVLDIIGTRPAKALAALVGVDADLPATEALPARHGLFVAGVKGAPGDGNEALAAALKAVLPAAGIEVALSAGTAAHVIDATVVVDPPSSDGQRVRIRWRVTAPDGTVLGEAAQDNVVPAHSLDGHWGPVAGLAAHAAIGGIADVLDRAVETRPAGPAITVPASPDLPPPPVPAATPPSGTP